MTKRRPPSPPPTAHTGPLDADHIEALRARSRHDPEARAELLSLATKGKGKGRAALTAEDFTRHVTSAPPAPPESPSEPAFEVVSIPGKRGTKPVTSTTDRWAGVKSALANKPRTTRARAATKRKSRRKAASSPRKPRRYLEDEIQKAVAAWLDTTPLSQDWLHPPLEQFNARWAKQMAAKGARSGWPDILCFRPTRTKRRGLAIELKRPDRQREGNPRAGLSKTQAKRLDRLAHFGWAVAVAYSLEQVQALFCEHYGDLETLDE